MSRSALFSLLLKELLADLLALGRERIFLYYTTKTKQFKGQKEPHFSAALPYLQLVFVFLLRIFLLLGFSAFHNLNYNNQRN